MNIYEERDWKKYALVAGLVILLAGAFFIFARGKDVYVEVSASKVQRGTDFYIFVHVKNSTAENEQNVAVKIVPETPYLHMEKNSVVIPVLPKHSEQIPKFKVFVDENAVPGDHLLTVYVDMGERKYKEEVYIKVV